MVAPASLYRALVTRTPPAPGPHWPGLVQPTGATQAQATRNKLCNGETAFLLLCSQPGLGFIWTGCRLSPVTVSNHELVGWALGLSWSESGARVNTDNEAY